MCLPTKPKVKQLFKEVQPQMAEPYDRADLGLVFLGAGINYPVSNADRWNAFVCGAESLAFSDLELDSLSFNELSVALEVRAGVDIPPGNLAVLDFVDELFDLIALSKAQGQEKITAKVSRISEFKGRILRSVRFAIEDALATATPQEFLELSGAKERHFHSRRSRYSLLRIGLGLVRRMPRFSSHHDQIQRHHQIFERSGLTDQSSEWSREKKATDVLLYRKRGNANMSCLVVFGGNARRPMMPVSLFLSALGDFADTVYLVRTQRNHGFRSGISGLGEEIKTAFPNLVSMISDTLASSRGQPVKPPVVLGTSGGGLPALIFSTLLPVHRVVLVGPNSTRDPRWSHNNDLKGALESRRLLANEGRAVPLTIVFGADGQDPRKVPDWRCDIPAADLVEVPGAGHNALLPLVEDGSFRTFLNSWAKYDTPYPS
jgi:hypothetical protein